jgi:hypothetical protein
MHKMLNNYHKTWSTSQIALYKELNIHIYTHSNNNRHLNQLVQHVMFIFIPEFHFSLQWPNEFQIIIFEHAYAI